LRKQQEAARLEKLKKDEEEARIERER
jgi:hypothetical protein